MYKTQDLESQLVETISTLGIPTIAYPQDVGNYFPTHSPGEALVRYDGCKPIARDVSGVHSKIEQYIEVIYVSRQLRDSNGLYEWLDKTRGKLEGYTLEGVGGHLELSEEGYYNYTDGTWFYRQYWKIVINNEYEQQNKHDTPIFGA